MAKSNGPAGNSNILQALILHQHQQSIAKAKEALEVKHAEMEQLKAEHDKVKKQRELDKKLHEETRKELEEFKKQYDPDYIMETRATKRDTMKRARLAKKDASAKATKKAREAKKTASKGSSARARTRQSAKKRA